MIIKSTFYISIILKNSPSPLVTFEMDMPPCAGRSTHVRLDLSQRQSLPSIPALNTLPSQRCATLYHHIIHVQYIHYINNIDKIMFCMIIIISTTRSSSSRTVELEVEEEEKKDIKGERIKSVYAYINIYIYIYFEAYILYYNMI